MKKQLLLFDFDGTIADTFHHIIEISNRLAAEFSFNLIQPHEIETLKDSTVEQTIEYLKVPKLKIPQILFRARDELHGDIADVQPITDLAEILHQLKALGYMMGIITTNSGKNVRTFLAQHDLNIFDFVSSTSKVFGKSRSLRRLVKKHNFHLDQAYYIGDEIRDIRAARKAGITVVAVTWGFNSKNSLEEHAPDYLVDTPEQLIKVCA